MSPELRADDVRPMTPGHNPERVATKWHTVCCICGRKSPSYATKDEVYADHERHIEVEHLDGRVSS